MPNPTYRSFLGIAKEAVKGTPVASTAYIPVTKLDPVDRILYLEDRAWRQNMALLANEVAGPAYTEVDISGPVFPDTVGYMINGVLGDLVTSGASAPFTHTISTKNSTDGQPVSFTLNDNNVVQNRQWAGCQFSEVVLHYDAPGLMTYDAKCTGFPSATASAPTASFTAIPPFANWQQVATIGGVASTTLQTATITIKRNQIDPLHNLDGTQGPYKVWVGDLDVDLSLLYIADDESQNLNYLNNSQPSIDLNFTSGAGAATVQVKVHCTKGAYTASAITRGKSYVEYTISGKAVSNATDAGASGGTSPVKVTLQNALPANTFG